jgi:hypothetical protein
LLCLFTSNKDNELQKANRFPDKQKLSKQSKRMAGQQTNKTDKAKVETKLVEVR